MMNMIQYMSKESFIMKYDLDRKISNYGPALFRAFGKF